jgi:hypothetical protein
LIISGYTNKKLVEYLEKDQKILIRFGHGWGDTLMFMPILHTLKLRYPDIKFDIYLENGQEEIFESYPNKNNGEHDLVFHLDFPMSEGTGLTKQEKCCQDEIGIEWKQEAQIPLSPEPSPYVAVHFQGTALPNAVNCPKDVAYKIWDEVIEFGKIPIECHFEHGFHNPVNKKYSFIDRSVRECTANLKNLIGLIQHSFAFVGVASGPFVTALSEIPERTMFLENEHKTCDYTKLRIVTVNVKNYSDGAIREWLNTL